MIPQAPLEYGLVVALWQVALHSLAAAALLYSWSRRTGLPSGRTRRDLLVLVLVVPLVTALVPGRGTWAFRERVAWFDSYRILGLPLPLGLHVWQLALALFAATAAVSLAQEVVPLLTHRQAASLPVSPELEELARTSSGLASASLSLIDSPSIVVATEGTPGKPRLTLSRGSLELLTPPELAAVLRHEEAHLEVRRWWLNHILFAVRLVQLYNPVALWAFREFTGEVEIACDRDAARVSGKRVLARALFAVYRSTSRRDFAARALLRRRIDLLLDRRAYADDHLPRSTRLAAGVLLLASLPWIV